MISKEHGWFKFGKTGDKYSSCQSSVRYASWINFINCYFIYSIFYMFKLLKGVNSTIVIQYHFPIIVKKQWLKHKGQLITRSEISLRLCFIRKLGANSNVSIFDKPKWFSALVRYVLNYLLKGRKPWEFSKNVFRCIICFHVKACAKIYKTLNSGKTESQGLSNN